MARRACMKGNKMGRTFAIDAVFERSRSIIFNSRLVVISTGESKLSAVVRTHDRQKQDEIRTAHDDEWSGDRRLGANMFVRSLFLLAISKAFAEAGVRLARPTNRMGSKTVNRTMQWRSTYDRQSDSKTTESRSGISSASCFHSIVITHKQALNRSVLIVGHQVETLRCRLYIEYRIITSRDVIIVHGDVTWY